MTAESCLYRQLGGAVSKEMPEQDGQGRKQPHMVSIAAHVPITDVEEHDRNSALARRGVCLSFRLPFASA